MRPSNNWTELLPFLAGTTAIIERVANRHHETLSDPEFLALLPEKKGELSWAQIRAAGHAALEQVGREIASAKTAAEAATAELRQSNYLSALQSNDAKLLQVASRALAEGPIPDFKTGHFTGLVGFGRCSIGGKLELVPSEHWEAGTMDWQKRQLNVINGTIWVGVRILDLADLNSEQADEVAQELLRLDGALPADDASSAAPRADASPRHLSNAELDRFLSALVAKLPKAKEAALWEAAKGEFPQNKVTRERVRDWIRNKMNPSKRLQRGDKPK